MKQEVTCGDAPHRDTPVQRGADGVFAGRVDGDVAGRPILEACHTLAVQRAVLRAESRGAGEGGREGGKGGEG